MYCSTCGVSVAEGLTYCNYCGANLNRAKDDNLVKPSDLKPGLLISAMVAVFVLGLIAISILLGVMKAVLNFDYGPILAFAMLSFLIMISIEGVFVRLLLHRTANEELSKSGLPKKQTTKELDKAKVRELAEPVPSVTEHTTRTFEPIYEPRKSN